uniref:Capsid protein n=1 Tax=Camellia chlorotic dwarf-associated virus TaxID=2122733 RepID=A0A5J6D3W7_9GEMI|nr:coat protein [Camellia chlorotic dwarf-associated virus]
MATTRSGRVSGTVTDRLPMWRSRRKRSARSRGSATSAARRSRTAGVSIRRTGWKGKVPDGCKGPCKTHSVDLIKTVYHDGRGAGFIANIDKGDDLGNRDGRRVRITKVLLRGKVWLDVTNAALPGSNVCKVWIIKDRRPGNEIVNFTSLMDMTDSEPMSALIKMDYRDRFIVLRDMQFDLHGGKDFRVDEASMDEMISVNCDSLFSHEDEGNLSHCLENGILVYFACSDPRNAMQITAQCRVYFFDSTVN